MKYDHLRASFIGSKIATIRLIASLLPIGALMLPLCSVIYSDGTTNRINAIELYKYLSSADIGSIFSSVNYFSAALGCLLLSAVLVLVALFALAASCGKMGKRRSGHRLPGAHAVRGQGGGHDPHRPGGRAL